MSDVSPKCDSAKLVESVSITAPAVRMVIVQAWSNEEQGEGQFHQIVPVVAIQASIVKTFTRPYTGRYPGFATLADLDRLGYRGNSSEVQLDYLVLDHHPDGYGLCTASEITPANGAIEAVACPWPLDQDADNLTKVIERVKQQAKTNEASYPWKPHKTEGTQSPVSCPE